MNTHNTVQSTVRLTRRTTFIAGIAALGVIPVARALAQEASPVTSENEAAFLFIQAGFTSGTLVANGDGSYQLALNGTPEQTVYFSDRPARIVGATSTARFLEVLGATAVDPPNAALAIQADDDNADILVCTLAAPVYDATAGSLTFTATPLAGDDQFDQTGFGFGEEPLAADSLPQEFGPGSLFIDDIHWNPGGF